MLKNKYYIVSVTRTVRRHRHIIFWGPNNEKYVWILSLAGKYDKDTVLKNKYYYNSGHTVAVPVEIVDSIAIYSGSVSVVPNTKKSWDKILSNLIATPENEPKPQYRVQKNS